MTDRSNSRPLVGAAVYVRDLEADGDLRSFLIERDRDVEVQDFLLPDVAADPGAIADRIARARRLLDGHRGRIGIHGPFNGIALDVEDPDIRAIASRRLADAVLAAAELAGPDRAPHVVVHSPFTTWNWHNLDARPGRRQQKIEAAHATLGEAVKRAEASGVTIVIENVEDKEPRDRLELARSFGSDAVRLSLDTGHAHYAHRATGGPPVDVYVRSAGNMLAHVHLQDCDGFADRHWRLGQGNIPWAEVFRAIAALDVQPRLTLELLRPADILPSARFLAEAGLAD